MPELPIKIEGFCETEDAHGGKNLHALPLTTIEIAALMLFPEDERRRMLFLKAEWLKLIGRYLHSKASQMDQWSKIAEIAERAEFSEITESKQFAEVAENAIKLALQIDPCEIDPTEPITHGLLVGRVIEQFFSADGNVAKKVTKRELLQKADEEFRADKKLRDHAVSVSHMNNKIWPRFARVAHLWGAYLWLERQSSSGTASIVPCAPEMIGSFLAHAEVLREFAETHKPRQAKGPLLDLGEAYRVPEEIALPKVEFEAVLA